MRRYYIFKQTLRLINVKSQTTPDSDYKTVYIHQWTPYNCIGFVDGVKGVRELFGLKKQYYSRQQLNLFSDTFQYNAGLIPLSFKDSNVRYVITDETVRIRNIREFMPEREIRLYSSHPAQCHWGGNANEMRQSITPDEIRRFREESGINLKPVKEKRRFINSWSTCDWHRKGHSWKEQSKRKHQYR